ncbi:retrovirus-related Pol polyprotein [Pseudoscourfieldia marina]
MLETTGQYVKGEDYGLIQNAQHDLKARAKLSRRLVGDDFAEVISDLLDDADISDDDADSRKRSITDAPPRRGTRRSGHRTYLTSAEHLYRTYRMDMRGACHGCLSPDHRQFDVHEGKWVCPNTQQRQDEGKLPPPGKSLPPKQRAFRVERTSPPPEVPPADDEEEDTRPDGTDNAGHASDGGHATTDGENDWDAPTPERKSYRISMQAAAYMAAQPPCKTQEELVTHRVLWDSCSDCNATGDKSIFML